MWGYNERLTCQMPVILASSEQMMANIVHDALEISVHDTISIEKEKTVERKTVE